LRCEHQTTGGYPKIATVISADLPALGRLGVGDKIRFKRVTLVEAEAARRAYALAVEKLPTRLGPVPCAGADLADRLCAANLISGVVHARHDVD
jgi:allophanate hydrolase